MGWDEKPQRTLEALKVGQACGSGQKVRDVGTNACPLHQACTESHRAETTRDCQPEEALRFQEKPDVACKVARSMLILT